MDLLLFCAPGSPKSQLSLLDPGIQEQLWEKGLSKPVVSDGAGTGED